MEQFSGIFHHAQRFLVQHFLATPHGVSLANIWPCKHNHHKSEGHGSCTRTKYALCDHQYILSMYYTVIGAYFSMYYVCNKCKRWSLTVIPRHKAVILDLPDFGQDLVMRITSVVIWSFLAQYGHFGSAWFTEQIMGDLLRRRTMCSHILKYIHV